MMNSEMLGKNTLPEVTNVSNHGIWLLTKNQELFLSYEDFPWFKNAPVGRVLNVEERRPGHFYWPDLDVDLTTEIIEHPEHFPLKAATSLEHLAIRKLVPISQRQVGAAITPLRTVREELLLKIASSPLSRLQTLVLDQANENR